MTKVTTKRIILNVNKLQEIVGNTDIYLLDQILKNRFSSNQKIMDAGCGKGRNLTWFYQNGFTLYGIDKNKEIIAFVKKQFPEYAANFVVSEIEKTSFASEEFHHIICNAVLHFATNETHFFKLFSEIFRLLKPNGILFIRMASNLVLKEKMVSRSNGRYLLPDGTERFLLTKEILNKILNNYHLTLLEPVKTTNVNDIRSMTTLVFKK